MLFCDIGRGVSELIDWAEKKGEADVENRESIQRLSTGDRKEARHVCGVRKLRLS